MFYLGPAGNPEGCRTTEEGIRKVASLGLNAMEVQFVRGVKMPLATAKRIGNIAIEVKVNLSAHAPYFINFNGSKETIAKSKVHVLKTAELANEMSAKVIVIHAGYYMKKPSAQATIKIREGIHDCAEQIEKQGWDVFLGLETMGKLGSWGTLDELKEVCKGLEKVVPVLDFAHLYARSKGSLKKSEDFENILKKYESIFSKFLHSHFTCVEYGVKGEKKHLTLEESNEPDFTILARVLKKRSYDITIISESPILEIDALKMKEIIEKI